MGGLCFANDWSEGGRLSQLCVGRCSPLPLQPRRCSASVRLHPISTNASVILPCAPAVCANSSAEAYYQGEWKRTLLLYAS